MNNTQTLPLTVQIFIHQRR